MQRVFQTFADRIAESREPEALRVAMADTAAAMELPCFAYLRLPRDGRSLAALISTYPTPWTDHYLKEHYERLDPVILSAHERSEPFHWGPGGGDIATTRRQEQFFDEALPFGINCGFTIPIHDGRGPLAAVTFASNIRRAGVRVHGQGQCPRAAARGGDFACACAPQAMARPYD